MEESVFCDSPEMDCSSGESVQSGYLSEDDDDIEILEVKRPAKILGTLTNEKFINHNASLIILKGKLQLAREMLVKQRREINELQEKNKEQKSLLSQANNQIKQQQATIESLQESEASLKYQLDSEREERHISEKNLDKIKTFVKSLNNEIEELIESSNQSLDKETQLDVQQHLQPLYSKIKEKFDNVQKGQEETRQEICKVSKVVCTLNNQVQKFTGLPENHKIHKYVKKQPTVEKKHTVIKTRKQRKKRETEILGQWTVAEQQCEKKKLLKMHDLMHFRDITKRELGYFCVCGSVYCSRKRLDRHIQRFGSVYTDVSDSD